MDICPPTNIGKDPNYNLDDETLETLAMKINPNDFVKTMRELLTQREGSASARYFVINALLLKQANTDAKECQVLSLAVDSGAGDQRAPDS